MSLGVLTLLSKISFLLNDRIIIPRGSGSTFGMIWNVVWTWIGEGICTLFYGAIKWLLAFVDFMQYFVQKLIGLDYWLNRSTYTLEGALESDLIFGFLYNDVVQKVFRAMVGVFFVLLIIFTIYAIIKSEWDHITGGANGGKFGDGTGNSKTKVFRNSLKAIALVMIFPLMLSVGVVSANAILASLIKALNIDTSSTLGGQLFEIGTQTANKYENYAHGGARGGVSDEVTFYIYTDANGISRYVTLGNSVTNDLVYNCGTYEEYLNVISKSKKYTVDSVFKKIDIGVGGINAVDSFYGYLAEISGNSDSPYFVFVYAEDEEGGELKKNSKEAYYHYLTKVLQVSLVTPEADLGFFEYSELDSVISNDGYINGLWLKDKYNREGGKDIVSAVKNTWNYADVYAQTFSFESALNYTVTRPGQTVKVSNSGQIGFSSDSPIDYTEKTLLEALGLGGVTSAKVMYNTEPVSLYMDGGQLGGMVQLQAEYMVMSEVINFICENNFKLHIVDITSKLIDWGGEGDYVIEDRWIALNGNSPKYAKIANGVDDSSGTAVKKVEEVLPFVVSYSDICNDTEIGNVLYTASKEGNELHGSKYIMCIEVNGAGNAKYIPVINNKTYTDPTTGRMYNFKSDYYTSNYHGVVIAKSPMCNTATNNYRGEPTYFVNKTNATVEDDAYYYDMKLVGQFNQFGANVGYHLSTAAEDAFTIEGTPRIGLTDTEYRYDVRLTTNNTSTYEYNIYKVFTDEAADPKEQIVAPNVAMIENVKITLKNGSGENAKLVTASYTGKNVGNHYMFSYLDGSRDWYFFVEIDEGTQSFKIKTCEEITGDEANGLADYQKYKWNVLDQRVDLADPNSAAKPLVAQTYLYWMYYDYTDATDSSKNKIGKTIIDKEVSPYYFDYSKPIEKQITPSGASEPTLVKNSIYTTKDMQEIESLERPIYINITFETEEKSLIGTAGDNNNPYITFAKIRETVFDKDDAENPANLESRSADVFIQRSQQLRFYLYDFYTASVGAVGSNGTLYSYNKDSGAITEITTASSTYFDIKIDSNDFEFIAQDSSKSLYDGKKYVATIYKTTSDDSADSIRDISQLSYKTTRVLYEQKEYLNVQTQNRYKATTTEAAAGDSTIDTREIMQVYYEDVQDSLAVDCVRDNRGWTFLEFDWAWIEIFKMRWKMRWFVTNIRPNYRDHVERSFYLTNGIQFDYFFEDTFDGGIKLQTFYIASEISYWILLIASILMIKVLGVAIWGVIKRVYEITLYFIAAPAVASTIPLDSGAKFKSSITDPLIQKVLATYGTMLGINIFFILLYPVKSLSKIFTVEDIMTTDSYFMKHFLSWLGSINFRVNVLNLYVYILFVLVAFTMIDSLPGVISKMIGAEDVKTMGEQAKKSAGDAVQSAVDFTTGKSLADGVGKIKDTVMDSAPVRLGKWIHDKVKKNSDAEQASDEGDPEEKPKDPKSREEEELNAEIDDKAKQKFAAENGMTYDEYVKQHGQEAADAKLAESRQEVENEIAADDSAEGQKKKEVLQRIQAKREQEQQGEKPETDGPKNPEEVAEQEFGGDVTEMAEQLTGDKDNAGAMQANAAKQAVAAGGEVGKKVTKAVMGGKSKEEVTKQVFDGPDGLKRKEQAVLSTMNADEQARYLAMKPEDREKFLEQYDVSAEVAEDGTVKMTAGKKGGPQVAVKDDVANSILADSMSAEQVNTALDKPENEEVKNGVAAFASENVAAAVDFSNAANDPLAGLVIDSIFADPQNEQNGAVMDQAIFDYLHAKGNEDILKAFQSISGLSEKQMKDPAQMMKAISELRAKSKDGMSIDGLKLGKDAYTPFMAGAVQKAVQTGEFKVSAWDLFNQVDPEKAQQYVDNVAAENLIKTEEDVAYEQQQSQEMAKNMDIEAFMRVFAGQSDGKFDQIAQIMDKFVQWDPEEAKAILEGLGDSYEKYSNDYLLSDQEILRAKLISQQTGMTMDKVVEMMADDTQKDQLNTHMMDYMMKNMGKEGFDTNAVVTAFGFGEEESLIFTKDELDNVRSTYAENAVTALTVPQSNQIRNQLAAEMFGAENFTSLKPEEKKKLLEAMQGLSAYEVDQMLNAKGEDGKPLTRAQILANTKKKAHEDKAVREAMQTEDVPAEILLDAVEEGDQEAIARVRAASYGSSMLSPDEQQKIEEQAKEDVLYKKLFGKTKAEMLAEYQKQGKTPEDLEKDMHVKLTGKSSSAEAEAEIDAEVFAQFKAALLEEKGKTAEFAALRAEFFKNNAGAGEDDFIRHLFEGKDEKSLEKLGITTDDLTEAKEHYKAKKVESLAKERIDGYDADVLIETRKQQENATLIKLANGYGDYASQVGAELAKKAKVDSRFMDEARAKYKQEHDGKELDDASEEERNMFLFANYADKLDPKQLEEIKNDRVKEKFDESSDKGEVAKAAFAKVAATPEKFKAVFDYMASYDGGEKGNELADKIKEKAIREQIAKYEGQNVKLAHAIDPDKLGADERKRFEHRQNVLQAEMRSNPEIVANLFKNNTILEQDGIIQAILAAQGSTLTKNEDGTYTVKDKDGKETTFNSMDELKKGKDDNGKDILSTEAINTYMNSHEGIKDKLVNIGAQDIVTALDSDTQDAKKVDAALTSPYLRNQVTNEVLKEAGLDPTKDKEFIKQLIADMLKAEGREGEIDNITDANFSEYMAELALYGISGKGKDAKAGVYNKESGKYERDVTQFVNKTKELEETSSAFKTNLDREVTRIIDPANYNPETSSQQFFATRSVDEFRAADAEVHSMADAINKFNKKGFLWFGRGKGKIVTPGEQQEEKPAESKLPPPKTKKHKFTGADLDVYEQAKKGGLADDDAFKKYKASLGDKANGMSEYELMMNFLDSNEEAKTKYKGLADADAFEKVVAKSGLSAEEIKAKYGVDYRKGMSPEELAEALKSGNKAAKTAIQNQVKEETKENPITKRVEALGLSGQVKTDLVDDVDLARIATETGMVKATDEDLAAYAIANNAEMLEKTLGIKGIDAKNPEHIAKVMAYLNDPKNKANKERLSNKYKADTIKNNPELYQRAANAILFKQGKAEITSGLDTKKVETRAYALAREELQAKNPGKKIDKKAIEAHLAKNKDRFTKAAELEQVASGKAQVTLNDKALEEAASGRRRYKKLEDYGNIVETGLKNEMAAYRIDAKKKNVENIEIFQAFEHDKEAMAAYKAKYGENAPLDYQKVMDFIAEGDDVESHNRRKRLVESAKTRYAEKFVNAEGNEDIKKRYEEAKKKNKNLTYADFISQEGNEDIQKRADAAFTSDKKADVSTAIAGSTTLSSQAYGNVISDKDIIDSGVVKISDDDIYAEAYKDQALLARFGITPDADGNIDESAKAKIRDYLNDDKNEQAQKDRARISGNIQVAKARADQGLLKAVLQHKAGVDPSKMKVTDADYEAYAEEHKEDLKLTPEAMHRYVRGNDRLSSKIADKYGDDTKESVQKYYESLSEPEKRKFELAARVSMIKDDETVNATIKNKKAAGLAKGKEDELLMGMYGGKTSDVKRVERTRNTEAADSLKKAGEFRRKEDEAAAKKKREEEEARTKEHKEYSINTDVVNVENLETFKAFEAEYMDEEKGAELRAAFAAKGLEYNYENVMKFLAEGDDDEAHARRKKFKDAARATIGSSRKAKSTKKADIAAAIAGNQTLTRMSQSSVVTDEEVEAYAKKLDSIEFFGSKEARDQKVIEAARRDAAVIARYGENASNEDIVKYLRENNGEYSRFETEIKADFVRSSSEHMDAVYKAKVGKNADKKAERYAETHKAEIKVTEEEINAEFDEKEYEKFSAGNDTEFARSEYRLLLEQRARTKKVKSNSELMTRFNQEAETELLRDNAFTGESKEVKNYKRTHNDEVAKRVKTQGDFREKEIKSNEEKAEAHRKEVESYQMKDPTKKNVENIEIFQQFSQDEEAIKEYEEKTGKKFAESSFEDVMSFIAKGAKDEDPEVAHARRKKFKDRATEKVLGENDAFRAAYEKARELDPSLSMADFFKKNKAAKRYVNAKLGSTNAESVAAAAVGNVTLARSTYNDVLTDEDIIDSIKSGNHDDVKVDPDSVLKAAYKDKALLTRLGYDPSKPLTKEDKEEVAKFLNTKEGSSYKERIETGLRVAAIRKTPEKLDAAYKAKITKNAAKTKISDSEARDYVAEHGSEISVDSKAVYAHMAESKALREKCAKAFGKDAKDITSDDIERLYNQGGLSQEEYEKHANEVKVEMVKNSSTEHGKKAREIKATNELMQHVVTGESREVKNYRRTEDSRVAAQVKEAGEMKKKADDEKEARRKEIDSYKLKNPTEKNVENIETFKAFEQDAEAMEKFKETGEEFTYENVMKFLNKDNSNAGHERRKRLREKVLEGTFGEETEKQYQEALKVAQAEGKTLTRADFMKKNKAVQRQVKAKLGSKKATSVAAATAGIKSDVVRNGMTVAAQRASVTDADIEAYIESDAGKNDAELQVKPEELIAAAKNDAFIKARLGENASDDAIKAYFNSAEGKTESDRITKGLKVAKAKKSGRVQDTIFNAKLEATTKKLKKSVKVTVTDDDISSYLDTLPGKRQDKIAKNFTDEELERLQIEYLKRNPNDTRVRNIKNITQMRTIVNSGQYAEFDRFMQIENVKKQEKVMDSLKKKKGAAAEQEAERVAREQAMQQIIGGTDKKPTFNPFVRVKKTPTAEQEAARGATAKKNADAIERRENSINLDTTTVENIEMFKAFEDDAEAMAAFKATGQEYNYQNVMKFMAQDDNLEIRKRLKAKVKESYKDNPNLLKSKKKADIIKAVGENPTLRKGVVTDASILDFLKNQDIGQIGANLDLKNIDPKFIIEAVRGKGLYGGKSDEAIIAAWKAGEFNKDKNILKTAAVKQFNHISDAELAARARGDAFISAKLGKNASDAQYIAYLNQHQADRKRFENQVLIDRFRRNGKLMDRIKSINDGKYASDAEVGDFFSGSNPFKRYKRSDTAYGNKTFMAAMGVVSEGFGRFFKGERDEQGVRRNSILGSWFTAKGKQPKVTTPKPKPEPEQKPTEQGPRKNPLIVGQNGVVFAVKEKVPKESHKFDNWNRVIQHKITQVKQDRTLTRAQKEIEIRKLESQIIHIRKPAYYKNLPTDQQNDFDLQQEKLKRMAIRDKNLSNYIKVLDRVRRGEVSEKDIPRALRGELDYGGKVTKDRKEKHLDDYRRMNENAKRFKATAAMRNMERDYGDEFEKFAKSFMSQKQYNDMLRRYKLANAIRYKDMTIREREAERRRREQAMAAQITRLSQNFARKVAKDKSIDRKTRQTFLATRGYETELLRYRNGITKFTESKAKVPHIGRSEVKAAHKMSETVQIQQRAASVDEMMREFVKFNSTFKGNSQQFAEQLKELAKKMGIENQKMIENIYKKNGKALFIFGKTLEGSTVSVQQRKIMEGLAEELRKCQQRLTSSGKIAASKELANLFVGKTYSGATTKSEVELHKQNAEDLSRLVKLIKDQRGLVSYDSLAKRVNSTFMSDFMNSKDAKGLSGKSEEAKKTLLENYFKKRLDEALKLMHNDSYQESDKKKLLKLNGRMIKKSETDESKRSKVLTEAMKTADNPIYQAHVRNVNSAAEKVKNERFNLDELTTSLRRVQEMPRTSKTIKQIAELERAIRDSKVKLNALRNIYNTAQTRKTSYEQAFASTQIKEAKAVTRARAINSASASVLDRYTFQRTDGTVVQSGSVDAKQIQMLVSSHIQSYRQSIERMLKDEVIKKDDELRRYIDGMESKFTADFGRNMKYTKQVRDELQRYVDEIDKKGKSGDQLLRTQLMDYIRTLTAAEANLSGKLKGMKIDVSKIALKK